MTRYVANTDQILAFVEKARAVGQSVEQRVAEVEREVAALHVEWEGDSAAAHRAKHETWQREMQDMRTALTGLEAAVASARDRYLENVERNMRMWP